MSIVAFVYQDRVKRAVEKVIESTMPPLEQNDKIERRVEVLICNKIILSADF